MRIRKITTAGFVGLPDATFDLSSSRGGPAARFVCVTGAMASGKTSLLEAIIAAKEDVGPYGAAQPASRLLRPGEDVAKVRVTWELSRREQSRWGAESATVESESIFGMAIARADHDPVLSALLGEYDPSPEVGKVEYFHAPRRIPLGAPIDLTKQAGSPMDKMLRLVADDAKYSSLVRFIVEAGLGLRDKGKATPESDEPDDMEETGVSAAASGKVSTAFGRLCNTKRLAGLYRVGDAIYPGFFDAEGVAYGAAQLSAAEHDALLFAASFVRSGLSSPLSESLLLIDTPELFKSDQQTLAFVEGLLELGQQNQIVVASTSPLLIGRAEAVVHLGRAPEGGS